MNQRATNYHLGIDLGSVSIKVVLLDDAHCVQFSRWTRVAGAPLETLAGILGHLKSEYAGAAITSIGVTGSGRPLIVDALAARTVNELSAHAAAAAALLPEIRTVIEIGGQDSKLVLLEENDRSESMHGSPSSQWRSIRDFRMNELCAAGTGAFLDQQANRLGLTIEQFARLAAEAASPVPIAGRCAVFAKTDMTHHQQEGRSLPDIVAGLNEALARSYLANLVRGQELPRPISFQGGVAANKGLAAAFRHILGVGEREFIVPQHHLTMGAIGAALIAAENVSSKGSSQTLEELIEAFDRHRNEHRARLDNGMPAQPKLAPPKHRPTEPQWDRCRLDGTYLGIDVGSVSVKLTALGAEGIRYSDYRLSDGRPIDVLRSMIADMSQRTPELSFKGAGVTGSGRHFVGKLLGADIIQNEITAQALATSILHPDTDTIIEIGGQDAKFIRIEGGRSSHFSMNRVCAAGTGAFLHEQAKRLNVEMDREFSEEAFASDNPAALGARCTVFMESDLVSHQQQGYAKRDLIAGLAISVVVNYLEKVVAGHPIGHRILFLGGVAENRSVVAALEAKLGRAVATSKVGKLSGAIGAALAAYQARRNGVYTKSEFTLAKENLAYEKFTCEDCANMCRITKTVGDRPHTFGGRCGKWDQAFRRPQSDKHSFLKRRQQLLEGTPRTSRQRRGKRIGIPRALLAYDMLPAWRTFFEELGCEVVLSPPTDDALLTEGIKRLVVETCLPVKAFCAHLHHLESLEGVDYLFVPSYVITGSDVHNRETAHCPYILSAVQFARPIVSTPILNPVINWDWHPRDEERGMVKIAGQLGFSNREARRAWRQAQAAQRTFRHELRDMGQEVLAKLKDGRLNRAFVLLGKDYNIQDPKLNSHAARILESRGETVLTQDMLTDDEGHYSRVYRSMVWSHGKEILSAAQIIAATPGLCSVLVTSFGCGPDSFTIPFARDIMGEKPMLLLEVDEHSSSIGMETRIEAFLDALPQAPVTSNRPGRQAFKVPCGIRRVFLPNFSDHGYAFAATMRCLGLEPVLTELPDDDSARLGTAHASSGECHPYVLMLGDYLKVATSDRDLSDACYFMPESSICRVGQFGTQMRHVAEEKGARLPVFTRVEDFTSSIGGTPRATYVKALLTFWEMMRGMDFLMQKYLETRAYETQPGAADRAHRVGRKELLDHILADRPLEGLGRAIDHLESVPIDRNQKRVRIGITGDYYTRVCDYANNEIFRQIEQLGGVVWLPPTLTEFVKYDTHQKPIQAFHHRKAADLLQALAIKSVVNRRERKVRGLFGNGLGYEVPLEYERGMDLIRNYMDSKLPTGLTGSVAAILEQIHAGADGVLNLITFHCAYGLIIGSVMKLIDEDFPGVPKLTLIFEGLKPTHNRLRLEAFMEQVHESVRRRTEERP
jgi:predicted CoA-substrate-specific enzyme activase